jgi:phage-related protein
MPSVYFYKDGKGIEPVREYLLKLATRSDKSSRVKLNKMNDYIQILREYGTIVGLPYMRHLEGEIWELRPIRNRILFAAWTDDGFVLLHIFTKKTQKTPRREIDKAKRELKDIQERGL